MFHYDPADALVDPLQASPLYMNTEYIIEDMKFVGKLAET
jgi:hypothetical protein